MTRLLDLVEKYLDGAAPTAIPPELRHLLVGVSRLLEVTEALAAEIDSEHILTKITEEACKALRCARASLYRYDAANDELFTTVATELEIDEIRHGLDRGITGYVARQREIVNIANPAADPRWNNTVDQATGFQTRNILAAPLIAPSDGSLLGVLQLLNRDDGEFDAVDEELLAAFSHHAAIALDRVRVVEELRRQESVHVSLEVARAVQRGFMPSKLPTVPRYEMATWWFPNEAVGGDYCDVIPLKDGRIGLVIADVSGHGLGPSLIMASLRAALHAMVLEHAAPEVLLNLLGRSMAKDLQDGRFITMALAALDPQDNSLEYSNAGHSPALHYDAHSGEFTSLESTGMPLGVLERPEYPQGWPIEIEVGDLVVLATDGIVEAMDPSGEQFGQQQLEELIRSAATRPMEQLVKLVGREVESHYKATSPPDDLTILAIRRNR